MGVFRISRYLVNLLQTSNDFDMKLGPVTKLDKKNTARSKNLTMASCQQVMMSLSFYQFMANLEQSGGWILDAWCIKLVFSLIVSFTLQKLKKELKNLEHSSNIIVLSKGTIFAKNADFFAKKMLTSAKLRSSWY